MTDDTVQSASGVERSDLHEVTCESWGEDSMYPLHEQWAEGEIEGREYRILRSLQGPHILVEFADEDAPVAFELGDLLQHAHDATSRETAAEVEQQ